MDAESETLGSDQLDILATLVEAYERKAYPMDIPDPVETIKFHMERSGMTPKDLKPMIGNLNRVYAVLKHTHPLTLPMIRKLHSELRISAESLIKASVHA